MKIYLASKSPRRKELLQQMDVAFELLLVETPEIIAPDETPETYSLRVTKEKMAAAQFKIQEGHLEELPLLCADTEVVLDAVVLGKPENRQEAYRMLKSYSGRTHEVITTVGIMYKDYFNLIQNKTYVSFGTISDAQINHYLESGDYEGKSGSYGIQSYMGQFISHIEGCFYSVMGLPLHSVRTLLLEVEGKYPDLL